MDGAPYKATPGQPITAASWNKLVDAAFANTNIGDGMNGNTHSGKPSSGLNKTPDDFWVGKVVTSGGGSGGGSDFTDNHYWIERQDLSVTGSDPTVILTWTTAAAPNAMTVAATNMAEMLQQSHLLPAGAIVHVWEEWDTSSPPLIRYKFSSPTPSTFAVKVKVDGGIAGSMQDGTNCSWTYTIKTWDTVVTLGTTKTPDVTRFQNCKYDRPSDNSPGVAYYDFSGGIHLYSIAQEKPTGSVVTNITDIQVVDSQQIQIKTQDQLVLDNKNKTDWTTIYTGSLCSS